MIEVTNLTKRYGGHTAVSNLSFSVEEGQVYGFLGPNGAGKSTTMNIMTGCLAATSGQVKICGYDIFEEATQAKRLIGYLPEQPPLYLDRTPREYLEFVARAKGVKRDQLEEQLTAVMAETGISHVADRLIKNLSKGYRQRVGIAQALLGDPKVIILDEPTVGLDPRQMVEIRSLIQSLGKKHTVILSSHILSEVQAVCQKILIISGGKLVACDTPENLEKLFAGTTTVSLIAEGDSNRIAELLADLTITSLQPLADGRVSITLETRGGDEFLRDLFFRFCDARVPILQMTTSRVSLEEIFMELTGGSLREEPQADGISAPARPLSEPAPEEPAEKEDPQ